jgi:hypothetical protein
MEITDLTPAERRVWEAFSQGEGVDFRERPGEDPAGGASWGPERTVRATVLRALLAGGPVRDGEIAGLKLAGARISGRLDLRYGTVDHPVRLRSCHFEQPPQLYGGQIRALVLSDSVLPGLSAATLRVDGVLRITGCRIAGPVRLQGAKVAGGFFLNKARLGHSAAADDPVIPNSPAHEAAEEPILQLNHAEIGTDVWAVGLVAHGQVRLDGATVGGRVNLEDAALSAPGVIALQAETLSVATGLHGVRLRVQGQIVLSGARIPRHLNLAHAQLSNPGGEALSADSCAVGELWLRETAPIVGTVDLRRSQLGFLHALPDVWPAHVRIDGLSYRTLAPHLPAERRLPLLEREADGHLPFVRAAGWLLLLLVCGAIAFSLHHPRPVKPDEAPDFTPVVYTIDLLLPIVSFGQETAFAPQGWYQWLAYLLIATGWVLATTIAAGITRTLNRQ